MWDLWRMQLSKLEWKTSTLENSWSLLWPPLGPRDHCQSNLKPLSALLLGLVRGTWRGTAWDGQAGPWRSSWGWDTVQAGLQWAAAPGQAGKPPGAAGQAYWGTEVASEAGCGSWRSVAAECVCPARSQVERAAPRNPLLSDRAPPQCGLGSLWALCWVGNKVFVLWETDEDASPSAGPRHSLSSHWAPHSERMALFSGASWGLSGLWHDRITIGSLCLGSWWMKWAHSYLVFCWSVSWWKANVSSVSCLPAGRLLSVHL